MDYLLIGEESERLYYRKIEPPDFDAWLPFHENPTSTQYWSEITSDPKKACQNWFKNTFYRYDNHLGGLNALVEKNTGLLVGQCGLLIQTVDGIQELEIGYSLLPAYRKRGYAIEAAKKCKSFAIERQLAKSLISIIHIDNIPSQQVALKNGMTLDKATTYKNNPVHIFRVNNQ